MSLWRSAGSSPWSSDGCDPGRGAPLRMAVRAGRPPDRRGSRDRMADRVGGLRARARRSHPARVDHAMPRSRAVPAGGARSTTTRSRSRRAAARSPRASRGTVSTSRSPAPTTRPRRSWRTIRLSQVRSWVGSSDADATSTCGRASPRPRNVRRCTTASTDSSAQVRDPLSRIPNRARSLKPSASRLRWSAQARIPLSRNPRAQDP